MKLANNNTNEDVYIPTDYSKIRVGIKTLDDAVI
jgi:hypothetical protein